MSGRAASHLPAHRQPPGPQPLKQALDTLFQHPNVGPFFGRQFIQHLVTSNPSPAYVVRVAAAFDATDYTALVCVFLLGGNDHASVWQASNPEVATRGWGSHPFIVGGAVRGAAFYGQPPAPSIGDTRAPDDQWHVGQGRLIPTTGVDQLAATLGRWFGASPAELQAVLPNLRHFGGTLAGVPYPLDLGFMR